MTYSRDDIANIASELVEVVDTAADRLSALDESSAAKKPEPGKWSPKEIIGHLIDSAGNNHQRFVRASGDETFVFPDYAQDDWVERQAYNTASWPDLLSLWRAYNRHIAHVFKQIPDDRLGVECRIGDYKPCSLGFLIDDYLQHLKHHLKALPL